MAELVKFLLWLVWQLLSSSANDAKNERQRASYCLDYLVPRYSNKGHGLHIRGIKGERLQAVFSGDCGRKVFITLGVASAWLW